MKELMKLMRIEQWMKNCFVFLPMFFAGQIGNGADWIFSLIGFISFSFAASGVYCLNDVMDLEEDRLHREKRNRPVAGGKVTVRKAFVMMGALFIAAFLICFLLKGDKVWQGMLLILIYLVINVLYCLGLKEVAILDVVLISIGYVLRLLWGGIICDIWLSHWIIILTLLIALFLAVGKRRAEVILYRKEGKGFRKGISRYNLTFLNMLFCIIAGVTLVCYIFYTVSPEVIARFHTDYLYISSIFVLVGILRYLRICFVDGGGENPTMIVLKDRGVQLSVIGLILFFIIVIY